MRICDKCGKKHANTRIRVWDLCETCVTALDAWICTPDQYVVSETLDKGGSVKSREIYKQCTDPGCICNHLKQTYPSKPVQMEYGSITHS